MGSTKTKGKRAAKTKQDRESDAAKPESLSAMRARELCERLRTTLENASVHTPTLAATVETMIVHLCIRLALSMGEQVIPEPGELATQLSRDSRRRIARAARELSGRSETEVYVHTMVELLNHLAVDRDGEYYDRLLRAFEANPPSVNVLFLVTKKRVELQELADDWANTKTDPRRESKYQRLSNILRDGGIDVDANTIKRRATNRTRPKSN